MKKISKKITLNDIIDNSMALFLVLANFVIFFLLYGNTNVLYTWQMFFIVGFIYLSLRFYQKYKTDTGDEKYKFLKKNHLGILFAILIILSTAVGFFADLMVLSQF